MGAGTYCLLSWDRKPTVWDILSSVMEQIALAPVLSLPVHPSLRRDAASVAPTVWGSPGCFSCSPGSGSEAGQWPRHLVLLSQVSCVLVPRSELGSILGSSPQTQGQQAHREKGTCR